LSLEKSDKPLKEILGAALDRMTKEGYPIKSKVRLLVDPHLSIMGYAKEVDGAQHVVISSWALRSEMLDGLILHELAHIYHTERGSPSHRSKNTTALISEFAHREGLSGRETGYLVEAFSHLQNILVDDIVFAAMSEAEKRQARAFFAGWVTDEASGYPLADSAGLVRNAFATASLKRHDLFNEGGEMAAKSLRFTKALGPEAHAKFAALEAFLVGADSGWKQEDFDMNLTTYLDLLIGVLREKEQMEDLR
jgi:hypothetical protein